MTICSSCAATPSDGAIFPPKERGKPVICGDCAMVAQRLTDMTGLPRTRASYRAALRHRRASAQMDLVDMIVRTP